MRNCRYLFVLILAAGCTSTLSAQGAAIVEADAKMIATCNFLGTVIGSSGYSGLAQSVGILNAKHDVIEKSAEMGATHVVFQNVQGGFSPSATGRAYKCNNEQSAMLRH